MKLTELNVDEIKQYENNNKDHSEYQIEEIRKSIEKYGYQSPIIVDADGVIIVGHARYEAIKRLGRKKVQVIVADNLTEDQVREYRIIDNRLTDFGTYNIDKLTREIAEITKGGDTTFLDLFASFDLNIETVDPTDAIDQLGGVVDDFARASKQDFAPKEGNPESDIKKLEFFFSNEEFVKIVQFLEKVCDENDIDSYSSAILHIATNYENTISG